MSKETNDKTNHLPGVSEATKKNGTKYYRSSITYRQKHISLGSYNSAEAAHNAYLEASMLLNDPSMQIVKYHKSSPLPFEKWICIINFRDNNIYFHPPIYIGQKLFFYYLSPSLVLKFDMDDLFYFSSHKIMKRGRHYFVADYGSQVNIVNRYGIKNYAVLNRDYRFINGDETDFRRQNIDILNLFHGIKRIQKNGQYTYTAQIHINGNYKIGTYTTELEAAIAYNKAVDILRQKGIGKNFLTNYIDQISPSNYAEIYTNLSISKKIYNYKPTAPNNPQN